MGAFVGDGSKKRVWKFLSFSKVKIQRLPIRLETSSNPQHRALGCAQMRWTSLAGGKYEVSVKLTHRDTKTNSLRLESLSMPWPSITRVSELHLRISSPPVRVLYHLLEYISRPPISESCR